MISKIKIKDLSDKFDKLVDFINSNQNHTNSEIYNWIAESVGFFTHVGVNEIIVKSFIDTFQINQDTNNSPLSKILNINPSNIGPFILQSGTYDYKLEADLAGKIKLENLYYMFIALRTANSIIDLMDQEQRLIPAYLINTLSKEEKYSHLLSSLTEMEKVYVSKDPEGLCKHSVTLLGSILDIESTLKGKNLGKQITILLSNTKILDKFGASKDLIIGLNNSRITRNYLSAHKNLPLKYDIPFMVSVSFAYLVLLFLEITLSTDEVFSYKK